MAPPVVRAGIDTRTDDGGVSVNVPFGGIRNGARPARVNRRRAGEKVQIGLGKDRRNQERVGKERCSILSGGPARYAANPVYSSAPQPK